MGSEGEREMNGRSPLRREACFVPLWPWLGRADVRLVSAVVKCRESCTAVYTQAGGREGEDDEYNEVARVPYSIFLPIMLFSCASR